MIIVDYSVLHYFSISYYATISTVFGAELVFISKVYDGWL